MKTSVAMVLLLCAAFICTANADVSLPCVIGDNMVLQRDLPVPIWGWDSPGQKVTVSFAGQEKSAVADAGGKWTVALDALTAGGPFEMTVTGSSTRTVKNVLVGEVWLASGQSNMQMRVRQAADAEAEVAAADYPRIRLFQVPHVVALEPQADVLAEWVECSPETAAGHSAVQYFFGRKLHADLDVPVGLIHSSWSGSLIEAWMSPSMLSSIGSAAPLLAAWQDAVALRGDAEKAAYEAWQKEIVAWREGWAAAGRAKRLDYPEAHEPFDPLSNYQRPSGLFNGMVSPLAPFAIRGALWYQGEGNSDRAVQYRDLFRGLINDWRALWGNGFHFYFVQLSSYQAAKDAPGDADWAETREAQSMALSLPNTAVAVCIDLGDAKNVHPVRKKEVGERLALAALALVHGREVEYAGPVYQLGSMEVKDGKVRLAFTHADGLETSDGKPPRMFQIAGVDRKWFWADAAIDGSNVVVSSVSVAEPVAVRYAWAANALEANLRNKAGLPAGTFRTDDWPLPSQNAFVWEGISGYIDRKQAASQE
jgi:sialate O-acetylesterase